MIDSALAAFAAAGRALIVGAVDDAGVPHATRGWGFGLDAAGSPFVVLDADDGAALACLAPGRAIAVTAADVRTLESKQYKGTTTGLGVSGAVDEAVVDHYLDEFLGAIAEADGTARAVLERIVPSRFVACTFTCDAVFDQTPGPQAGVAVQ